MNLIFKKETYAIRGAAFEVYKVMGSGFLEAVYQECMEKEFEERNIQFISQPELELSYKSKKLKQFYKPDFICNEKIIVELKAVKSIDPKHKAQIINYLKATGLKLGLLVNFGAHPKVEIERFVL
jgi:GxxExxY protein